MIIPGRIWVAGIAMSLNSPLDRSAGFDGSCLVLAGTAKQTAGPPFPKPAADELKILPQILAPLQHGADKPCNFQPISPSTPLLGENTLALRVF
jgi:hypothetical protein